MFSSVFSFLRKKERKKGFVFFVRGRIQKEYVRCVFLSGVKIVRVERGMLCFFLQLNAVCQFSSVLGEFRAKKERKKFFKKKIYKRKWTGKISLLTGL